MSEIDLVKYYINKYKSDIKVELKEIEEKRVKYFIKELTNKDSIYKDLPFELLSIDAKCKLLYHFLEDVPEREFISNMGKDDVNRDFSNLIIPDETSDLIFETVFEDDKEYNPFVDLNKEKYLVRKQIRGREYIETETIISDLLLLNEQIIRAIKEEQKCFFLMGLRCNNYSYIKDYIGYVTDTLLQFLIYRVITYEVVNDKEKVLQSLVETMDDLFIKINKQVEMHRVKQDNLTAEEVSRIFYLYREDGSYYREYIEVIKTLRQEVKENKDTLFKELEGKYKAKKALLLEEDIYSKEIEEIITEGVKVDNYKRKLGETREFIEIFSRYGIRDNYSNCLQDIKVYFREIFMSKQRYKKRQSLKIVREYLKQCGEQGIQEFDNVAHYTFVREKINRGFFRETGNLPHYMLKLEFQEKLYETILITYLFYDYDASIEFIYELNHIILKRMHELLLN